MPVYWQRSTKAPWHVTDEATYRIGVSLAGTPAVEGNEFYEQGDGDPEPTGGPLPAQPKRIPVAELDARVDPDANGKAITFKDCTIL